jgi:hypothetical protein
MDRRTVHRPGGTWNPDRSNIMTEARKITIAESTKIARKVLAYLNSGIDPRVVDVNDQINGHLAEIGLGWKLKNGTYIDGLDCQFIGAMAKNIRASAIEKY